MEECRLFRSWKCTTGTHFKIAEVLNVRLLNNNTFKDPFTRMHSAHCLSTRVMRSWQKSNLDTFDLDSEVVSFSSLSLYQVSSLKPSSSPSIVSVSSAYLEQSILSLPQPKPRHTETSSTNESPPAHISALVAHSPSLIVTK